MNDESIKLNQKPILKLENIYKSFGPVQALRGVSLEAISGKCTAIVGENGAGKSTLMNIVSGVIRKTSGEMYFDEKKYEPKNIKSAEKTGIAIIHQELVTVNEMTVIDNIFLGNEIRNSFGKINYKEQFKIITRIFKELQISIDPKKKMGYYSVAQQQIIEIAKTVIRNAKVIIMDEPTSSLSDKETQMLFRLVKQLKEQGKAVLYISHRLEEIPVICEYITIIRDGGFIGNYEVDKISEEEIIAKMVGREITQRFPTKVQGKDNEVLLSVNQISSDILKNISFNIKKGEILGFAGLVGAKRTELFKTLIGAMSCSSKEIYWKDKKATFKSPYEAIKKGLFYVTEDRKEDGLILDETIRNNISVSSFKYMQNKYLKFISKKTQNEMCNYFMNVTKIKAPNFSYKINQLSGGNQQKVLISKAICAKPKIIIFDEPTRGVDIGARREIYDLISELKAQGIGIVIISSELPEIIGLCDRVVVMKEGRISKELEAKDLSQENIIKYAI
ncbi:ribose transport system ATP-binding protein [Spiroplasma chinense]|uniref:Ribose transport system ATP-binding protein n=1 Tax=Spiroplasma chinense TaxID=216932 RepID=A0A5B9Y3Y2_9MOLU|nr:sugar ABC transporter ATP-binding protein [Spiroplasma chinense]QEH61473.1 ribose transport system ATP-binding protein [Spiroplasma chinense]